MCVCLGVCMIVYPDFGLFWGWRRKRRRSRRRRGRRRDFDFHPSTFSALDSRCDGTSGGTYVCDTVVNISGKTASHGATPSLRLLP